jgi:hypothetical protein
MNIKRRGILQSAKHWMDAINRNVKNKFRSYKLLLLAGTFIFAPLAAGATPSTQIWIPSTDIQAKGTYHLGIDNYFTAGTDKTWSMPTDIGIEYGAGSGWEIGADLMGSTRKPLYFNFKYGIPEKGNRPALAAGSYFMGTSRSGASRSDYDIYYILGAKTIPGVSARLSIGAYSGNGKLLVDLNGERERTGLLASLDKQFTKKIWGAVDYQGGENVFGATSIGMSYAFADNVSVILGYDFYNEKKLQPAPSNTFTTQLDINF